MSGMSADVFVDWKLAARTGRRLAKAGPEVTLEEAKAAVEELREAALRADEFVSQVTEIAHPVYSAPTQVIDRPQWIDINAQSIGSLMSPLIDKIASKSSSSRRTRAVGSKVTGAEAGVLLAFLSSRVLGQYDVFGPGGGKLLLVAPNVIDAERRLGVEPSDFRLWVCIHEVTHRLQFTAVPWLEGYLREQIEQFVDASDFDSEALRERLKETVAVLRDRRGQDESEGLRGLVRNPEQRAVLDRMTAVMSLLEGHAEYVMDEVGPSVIPTVKEIRRKFAQRRKGRSPLDRMLRKLLGLDAKMRQYADGRAFVDAVVKEVGMRGFNHVWSSPQTLPKLCELRDAAAWVARVNPPGRVDPQVAVQSGDGSTTRTFTVERSGEHTPLNDLPDDERQIIIERRAGDN